MIIVHVEVEKNIRNVVGKFEYIHLILAVLLISLVHPHQTGANRFCIPSIGHVPVICKR